MGTITRAERIGMAKNFLLRLFCNNNKAEKLFSYIWCKRGDEKITIPFHVKDILEYERAAEKAVAMNDKEFNVFIGANLTERDLPEHARAKSSDIVRQVAVLVDIDIQNGLWHVGDKYPADIESAKKFLPTDSSLLVDSGAGIHSYFLFDKPLKLATDDERNNATKRNKDFIEIVRRNAGNFSAAVDAVHDLPRVLRLPGTYNLKAGAENAPLCREIGNEILRLYSVDTIDEIIRTHQKENPVPEKKIPAPIVNDNAEKPTEQERASAMLSKIPCAEQTYSDWITSGMILKNNGNALSDWEQWSATDFARFKPGECQRKWEGFSDNGGLTIATLHRFARVLYGYSEKDFQREWYSEHSPKKFQDNRAAGRGDDSEETDEEKIISSIRAKLERGGKDGNGQVKKSTRNIDYILSHDPRLKNLVGYDEFSGQDVFLKKPIWRKDNCVGKEWTDRDDAELRRYIALEYDDLYHEKRVLDCLTHYSTKNSFNAVQKFLSDIPAWDGTPRAETFFVDFLKVPDSPYSREVTLNFLFGALARIYYPGCEYQTALVLNGKQGIGKSYVLHELGGRWHISLNDEIGSAHAIDAIQPGWIVEIEEFRAGRKAEVNALKSFISAREDTRRAAYERRAKKTPRHCVFAASVNDTQFLRDRTGNRRFVILKCEAETNEVTRELSPEYVQQVWAEALFKFNELFKDGFDERKLRLSQETMIQAAEIASEHLQDDGLDAEVAAFVERKIPAAPVWELLTAPERRKFFEQSHIEINAEELRNRAKVNPRKYDVEKLNAVLDETKTITANGTVFYGTEYRRHICAAELNLECFAQTDRRKNMIRLNEVLAHLEGWQKGKRIQRDCCYGDLRNVYYRAEQPHTSEIAPVEVPF